MAQAPILDEQVDDTGSAENLSQAAYERIKSDILSLELAPRTRLRLGFVCDRYGFGTSPVREALTLLTGEGFVTRTDGRGFAVSDLTAEDYVELTETRCWLEEVALRNSMQRGDEAWEDGIVVAFYRFSRASRPAAGTSLALDTEWARRHTAFHNAMLGACGSRWLFAYCQQLREQANRYKQVSSEDTTDASLREHEVLMRAVLDRRPEVAVPLLTEHYRSKTKATLERLGKNAPKPEAVARRRAVRS